MSKESIQTLNDDESGGTLTTRNIDPVMQSIEKQPNDPNEGLLSPRRR